MIDATQHDIDLAIESLIHDISANSKVRPFVTAENPPNARADAVFDFVGQRSVSWVAYRELIVARLFDIQSLIRPTQETDPDGGNLGAYLRARYGTQETDPIRCQSRCDQYPNCQHDWRSWHNRPTQETDPG